jgi:hypothetical protein
MRAMHAKKGLCTNLRRPNHDPPKPLAQKKRAQISSPTLQIPKIPPPLTTVVATRK